ncbi:phosphoribosylformylglycinamidine cyclo-ligase [Peptoniphilus sp. KCTC 25270]|uniref:phosphoribosylformylglycinamidine cyclo-ligase n=1 Tax=Peptoniphilus sp. KCTC 25270 TaxID=2897414 RepID=UPI001E29E883|nr:phosphoribosylformylglycinamidine cyclo-ligase [Peptoniphilus sp. KCTC 25270]MCD1146653.1 phosphoribosylformylglycinamidine cyclo-ligase [Peptoniphilus sp. KCTC 25270]
MKISYEDAGVNISEGNRAVDLIKQSVKSTFDDNVLGEIGLFAGGYSIKEALSMEDPTLMAATDGVGTKLMIAQMMNIHNTVGIDLVAMCVNDLICQGAKPLFFLDYIATGHVEAEKMQKIVEGIADGCRQANCALIGGETAEMPGMYGEDDYDLAGFAVGIADRGNLIDGSNIEPADVIVGIKSSGLHSNGYSLARKLFFDHLQAKKDDKVHNMRETIGQALLKPTRIYVRTIQKVLDRYKVKGICNITGGGLIENVPRILPEDAQAVVYESRWEKGELFEAIESFNAIEREELFRSFNMGVGMVIVADVVSAQEIVKLINEETEDEAVIIGEIVKGEKKCVIKE